jgi:hypothetical protein
MVRIHKFKAYSEAATLAGSFVGALTGDHPVYESGGDGARVLAKIVAKLKLNAGIIMSFGTGMEVLVPLVRRLIENGEIKVDLNTETATLLTLTAITIAYLQEEKEEKARRRLERDSRSLLEELKLSGVGNGIVKKTVGCIKAIGAVARLLMRHRGHVLTSFFEMLGYTALCLPVINAIKSIVGTYHFTLDNFKQNMASVALGLGALSAEQGLEYLKNLIHRKGAAPEVPGDKMINEQ